jgi:hypothetical protein
MNDKGVTCIYLKPGACTVDSLADCMPIFIDGNGRQLKIMLKGDIAESQIEDTNYYVIYNAKAKAMKNDIACLLTGSSDIKGDAYLTIWDEEQGEFVSCPIYHFHVLFNDSVKPTYCEGRKFKIDEKYPAYIEAKSTIEAQHRGYDVREYVQAKRTRL